MYMILPTTMLTNSFMKQSINQTTNSKPTISSLSGLRGLMFAVLLVCSFSNISYTLDTLTAIFAVDFWNVVRKDASAWELHRAKRYEMLIVLFWIVYIQICINVNFV